LLAATRECKPTSVTAASSCVEDEPLFAFARGELAEPERQRIESHLRDCSDCRAVLAEAARSLEPEFSAAGAGEQGFRPGPSSIARYRIVTLLGAGAAGVVYRAFDPQLKRAVALKLLRPELHGASPEQSARMLREAQAMARLSDPHVVAVYDVGLHEGTVYLVMEYIDGHTLAEWLRAAPRSSDELLRVFGDAGRGLAVAHQKGLVHRDFKPENVLVAHDGRARVTDFGLARESDSWLHGRQPDDSVSTELYAPTRGLVGTPAYMAPELFEGGSASPASDQFAFCVALFTALFDKHPFKAGEGIALSELVTRVRAGTLQRPALNAPSQERLFGVLQRGLAAAPSARFDDMPQLLAALSAAARPRRGAWVLGFAAVALVLGGLTTVLLGAFDGRSGVVRSHRVASNTAALGASTSPPATIALKPPGSAETRAAAPASVTAASAAPRVPSASPPSTSSDKRRPPKPTDVRYKDWLKDPF
jgi:eukaryotic-like serine/threonine-protein kinase